MPAFRGAGRRRLIVAGIVAVLLAGLVFLLWPSGGPGAASAPTTSAVALATVPPSTVTPDLREPSAVAAETDIAADTKPVGLSHTRDYRALAVAAAQGIYTWDSRSASYSDVYARVRSWWELLPDGSNPLSVLVKEFEGTGVTAGSFTSLTEQSGRRSGTAQSVRCDLELAKVQEYPAPWQGLHVCTVTVQIIDETSSGRNDYSAPITVMLNCPPAVTAPPDSCAMVAFYATADRIVY